ncbi:hypothetical protein [Rhodococcus aetherivorans]|uniref:hypothetical protein n=1 Tax=Rhodococcus aetherivorans TaxID=191292 RepID=UPI001E393D1C|nr:hypothetical protein [Rhodococcus aetherivorans]UGQ39389.1 hypothetical protein LRQ66_14325 [Rhodococcus aetherivorans]
MTELQRLHARLTRLVAERHAARQAGDIIAVAALSDLIDEGLALYRDRLED